MVPSSSWSAFQHDRLLCTAWPRSWIRLDSAQHRHPFTQSHGVHHTRLQYLVCKLHFLTAFFMVKNFHNWTVHVSLHPCCFAFKCVFLLLLCVFFLRGKSGSGSLLMWRLARIRCGKSVTRVCSVYRAPADSLCHWISRLMHAFCDIKLRCSGPR